MWDIGAQTMVMTGRRCLTGRSLPVQQPVRNLEPAPSKVDCGTIFSYNDFDPVHAYSVFKESCMSLTFRLYTSLSLHLVGGGGQFYFLRRRTV